MHGQNHIKNIKLLCTPDYNFIIKQKNKTETRIKRTAAEVNTSFSKQSN